REEAARRAAKGLARDPGPPYRRSYSNRTCEILPAAGPASVARRVSPRKAVARRGGWRRDGGGVGGGTRGGSWGAAAAKPDAPQQGGGHNARVARTLDRRRARLPGRGELRVFRERAAVGVRGVEPGRH